MFNKIAFVAGFVYVMAITLAQLAVYGLIVMALALGCRYLYYIV